MAVFPTPGGPMSCTYINVGTKQGSEDVLTTGFDFVLRDRTLTRCENKIWYNHKLLLQTLNSPTDFLYRTLVNYMMLVEFWRHAYLRLFQ